MAFNLDGIRNRSIKTEKPETLTHVISYETIIKMIENGTLAALYEHGKCPYTQKTVFYKGRASYLTYEEIARLQAWEPPTYIDIESIYGNNKPSKANTEPEMSRLTKNILDEWMRRI